MRNTLPAALLLILTLSGCGAASVFEQAPAEPPEVLIFGAGQDQTLALVDSFEDHMTELGYIDGENISYVYELAPPLPESIQVSGERPPRPDGSGRPPRANGPPGGGSPPDATRDPRVGIRGQTEGELDASFHEDLDAILALGSIAFDGAFQLRNGLTPVVGALISPGTVDESASITLTGVYQPSTHPERLELLTQVYPGIETVYIPVNNQDAVGLEAVFAVEERAAELGVEIILVEITDETDQENAIAAIPERTDALFAISTQFLITSAWVQAAAERDIPAELGGSRENAIFTYTEDMVTTGQLAAEQIHRLLQGDDIDDIPFETGHAILTINLEAAEEQGLTVPQSLLEQADVIIE